MRARIQSDARRNRAAARKSVFTSRARQPSASKNATPFSGANFTSARAGCRPPMPLLIIARIAGRQQIEHPPANRRLRRQIARQRWHRGVVQVDDQPLGDDQRVRGALHRAPQEVGARRRVGEVDRLADQRAGRLLGGEQALLLVDEGGQVRLDPGQRARQRQPVRPRVEASGQVQHPVAALGDRLQHQIVDQLRARDRRPARGGGARRRGGDGLARARPPAAPRTDPGTARPGARSHARGRRRPSARCRRRVRRSARASVTREDTTRSSRWHARATRRRVLPARPGAARTST